MSSFSLDFPDDDILAILGDELTVVKDGGGTFIILGEFSFKYMADELGERIDIVYPVFDCNDRDAAKVKRNSLMRFNGEEYKFYKSAPVDENPGKTRIYMKKQ